MAAARPPVTVTVEPLSLLADVGSKRDVRNGEFFCAAAQAARDSSSSQPFSTAIGGKATIAIAGLSVSSRSRDIVDELADDTLLDAPDPDAVEALLTAGSALTAVELGAVSGSR